MIFDVITLFPEMIDEYCNFSILKRAVNNNILTVNTKSIPCTFPAHGIFSR